MTKIFFFILLQLFIAFPIPLSSSSPCPPSSCGNITHISYPFRLKTDPTSCGLEDPFLHLDCQNNQTVLTTNLKRYFVQELIVYDDEHGRIRLVDPGIKRGNVSSCPHYSYSEDRWSQSSVSMYPDAQLVVFIHCLSPVNSTKYVKAPFCGDRSFIFSNSSQLYSYMMYGEGYGENSLQISDLEEFCTVDKVAWTSPRTSTSINSSLLANIYDALADGFMLSWWTSRRRLGIYFSSFSCPRSLSLFDCLIYACWTFQLPSNLLLVKLVEIVIGFPLLIWLVVHKWRRRHLSMDKAIEKFLHDQHNLAPIKYTYSEIKKMTNNFSEKLGEGGYGTVYKGKLRSGPYVAIKMLEQSMTTEDEFINEVGTIGQIHHVNIVQLIGYCVEHSKYVLVYDFLPNGSLDRYIFNQQSVGVLALTFDKIFEIALGVARGISYLHHGCNIQILHFDIKPHNILLDETFNPKISDFGLAKLHPTHESFINLTDARGTIGYMAPEMFYKNIGRVSYKVDVYSFGMMLMEMVSRRKNMNYLVEEMSQIYFPSWVYDQLSAGKDINIKDATEDEKLIVKKIMVVALWCIQMKPSNRPSMNKVVEMLEDDFEPQMPPKPFAALCEMETHGDEITQTYRIDYVNLDLAKS